MKNNLINVDFTNSVKPRSYSADVYSFDRKKYQFHVFASSLSDAYSSFIQDSSSHGVNVVRCIAVYMGHAEERKMVQAPLKVWQRLQKGFALKEFMGERNE